MVEDDDDTETRIWRRALETLLAKGATYTEAVDGANLVLRAHRRKREVEAEAAAEKGPTTSRRRVPE